MEAVFSSETFVSTYKYTQRYNSEQRWRFTAVKTSNLTMLPVFHELALLSSFKMIFLAMSDAISVRL
jgi:hypothetical protein